MPTTPREKRSYADNALEEAVACWLRLGRSCCMLTTPWEKLLFADCSPVQESCAKRRVPLSYPSPLLLYTITLPTASLVRTPYPLLKQRQEYSYRLLNRACVLREAVVCWLCLGRSLPSYKRSYNNAYYALREAVIFWQRQESSNP